MTTLRFTEEELDAFAAASHDRNPLHASDAYARRTAFGRRVVFGVLSLLRAIAAVPPSPERRLAKLTVDFLAPLFVGIDYDVTVEARGDKTSVRITDGGRPMLRAVLLTAPGEIAACRRPEPVALRTRAAALGPAELTPGTAWRGTYWPDDTGELGASLRARGLSDAHVAALLACTYVVGMELPGERALFARLALAFHAPACDGPLPCEATVAELDDRFDLLTVTVRLGTFADGELRAVVRRPPIEIDVARLTAALPASRPLEAKVALVIGASRGLGAATALALARLGASVVGTSAKASGTTPMDAIELRRADATDAHAMPALVDEVVRAHGRLDLLVCCASPPVLPMSLSPTTATRAAEFVAESVRMVACPLASALPHLARSGGRAVIVSSVYVEEAPADFPHYVAAKSALEGLARAWSHATPAAKFLAARAPRFLSDMTNLGPTEDVARVEDVAAALCRAILSHDAPFAAVTLATEAR